MAKDPIRIRALLIGLQRRKLASALVEGTEKFCGVCVIKTVFRPIQNANPRANGKAHRKGHARNLVFTAPIVP